MEQPSNVSLGHVEDVTDICGLQTFYVPQSQKYTLATG
jgi:hypothetical protein